MGSIYTIGSLAYQGANLLKQQNAPQPSPTPGPYRPPQFGEPAVFSITDADGNFYVFDAVMRAGHGLRARATEHPVQTGAGITDHIVLEPLRVTLEIGMSDALDSYQSGMWTGSSSKSVSAFQTMIALQAARGLLTVSTRLKTYTNLILEDVQAAEDQRTLYGLRATLVFREVFLATVVTQTQSARPQTTNSTQQGELQPTAPSPATINQHEVTPVGGSGPGNSGGGAIVVTGTSEGNNGTPPPSFVTGGGNYTSGVASNLGVDN